MSAVCNCHGMFAPDCPNVKAMTAPKVPPPQEYVPNCMATEHADGYPHCSLKMGHEGPHRAYECHDLRGNLMATWRQAPAPPSTAPLTIEPHEFLGAAWALHYMGAFSEEWKANHSAVDVAEIIAKNFKLRGAPSTAEPPTEDKKMTDTQIKYMVERFLQWKLPENFNPDGGISFERTGNAHRPEWSYKREPTGTNLFDATQAEQMIRYLVDGMPKTFVAPLPEGGEETRLLAIRDALVNNNPTEAYHQLYMLADHGRNSLTPFDEWEKAASSENAAPLPSQEAAPSDCPKCQQPVSGPHECYESVLNQPQEAQESNRQMCKHCGLRIFLDKTTVLPVGTHWRHHGSNLRECYITFAEPGIDTQSAAYRAGRESAIREAAKECEKRFVARHPLGEVSYCADLAAVIEALPLSGKEDKPFEKVSSLSSPAPQGKE